MQKEKSVRRQTGEGGGCIGRNEEEEGKSGACRGDCPTAVIGKVCLKKPDLSLSAPVSSYMYMM